ncbi:MAG: MFS transporter [Anaerolineales bacterium]|nr:MAG: MFS transporter [Anaerolineales bacterium]
MSSMRDSLRVQLVFLTFVRMLISTAFRMVYPFLPVFRDALNVPLETLTRAVGLRSLVSAFAAPFLATVGDTRGRRTGIVLGLFVFILGVAVVSFWPTFGGFTLSMILMLMGKATFDPSLQAYIGDRVPYARRSAAITVTEFSWSGAFILGVPVMGWIIGRFGWLAPFQLLGVMVLLCIFAVLWMMQAQGARPAVASSTLGNFKVVMRSQSARMVLLLTLFTCTANELVALTFGAWLEMSFGLQLAALGAAAAVLGIAELSGEGLVALVTDRLGKRRAIVIGLLVNCAACVAMPIFGGSYAGALITLFFFYVSFEFIIVSSIPLMTEVLPAARATMMSGFVTFASIGRALASLVTPVLFAQGFGFNTGAAIAFNLLALWSLTRIQIAAENP